MKTINIIGSGNVTYHLLHALKNSAHYKIQNVAVRSLEKAKKFIDQSVITTDISALTKPDITIISVSDNAIKEVCDALPYHESLVVHTSGTTAMQILNNKTERVFFIRCKHFQKTRL